MGMYDELKNIISGQSIIRTIVPWYDITGDAITQFAFNTGGNMYTRTANEGTNNWNEQTRMIKANDKGTFRNSNRGSDKVGIYELCDIKTNDNAPLCK